jgi:hypothetical protein
MRTYPKFPEAWNLVLAARQSGDLAPYIRAISAGSGSTRWPQAFAPDDLPNAGRYRVAERHRRTGLGFHVGTMCGTATLDRLAGRLGMASGPCDPQAFREN